MPRVHVSTEIHGHKVWLSTRHVKGAMAWLTEVLAAMKEYVEKEISYEEFTGLRADMIHVALEGSDEPVEH